MQLKIIQLSHCPFAAIGNSNMWMKQTFSKIWLVRKPKLTQKQVFHYCMSGLMFISVLSHWIFREEQFQWSRVHRGSLWFCGSVFLEGDAAVGLLKHHIFRSAHFHWSREVAGILREENQIYPNLNQVSANMTSRFCVFPTSCVQRCSFLWKHRRSSDKGFGVWLRISYKLCFASLKRSFSITANHDWFCPSQQSSFSEFANTHTHTDTHTCESMLCSDQAIIKAPIKTFPWLHAAVGGYLALGCSAWREECSGYSYLRPSPVLQGVTLTLDDSAGNSFQGQKRLKPPALIPTNTTTYLWCIA